MYAYPIIRWVAKEPTSIQKFGTSPKACFFLNCLKLWDSGINWKDNSFGECSCQDTIQYGGALLNRLGMFNNFVNLIANHV